MNPRTSFARKIIYLVAIALLLGPLFWLSQPSTRESAGGQLAQLREASKLSEAELGEIDPTSETIKLATLGLRGVAVNILWEKSNACQKKKDWIGMSAVLNQIAKLEPHFISVWRHQAWRVSYNISTEFDDFHGRYAWVMKGIDFLREGIRYNTEEPILYWDVGWFVSQKIGNADEKKQFRQLFKDDDDFHGPLPREFRDNWLVGKDWFLDSQKLVDGGARLKGVTPVLFHSFPPKCQMDYAEALETDGVFGEKARLNWRKALEEWTRFGSRDVPTSSGKLIRLNDKEELYGVVRDSEIELAELAPGLRDKIVAEKRNKLTAAERAASDKPIAERSDKEYETAMLAQMKLEVSPSEIAQRVTGPNRAKALEAAGRLEKAKAQADVISSYRQIVNFEYWRRRSQFEQEPEALDARAAIYAADQALTAADLVKAKEQFEKGFGHWRKLLDRPDYSDLPLDSELGGELVATVDRYRRLLDKRDETMPDRFILQDIVDRFKPPEETTEGEPGSSVEQPASGQPASGGGQPGSDKTSPPAGAAPTGA